MKKLLAVSILVIGLFLYPTTNANGQSFQEGDLVINAGIGLGTTFSTYGTGFGLPIGAGVEYGVTNFETGSLGVGGDFGIVSGGGVTMTTIGARGSYYLTEVFDVENTNLDIYTGLGLYYRNFNVEGSSYNWGSGVYAAFHAGARYYFAENVGGYAELGNNWAWLNIGIVFEL